MGGCWVEGKENGGGLGRISSRRAGTRARRRRRCSRSRPPRRAGSRGPAARLRAHARSPGGRSRRRSTRERGNRRRRSKRRWRQTDGGHARAWPNDGISCGGEVGLRGSAVSCFAPAWRGGAPTAETTRARADDRRDQRHMEKTSQRIGGCETPHPEGGEQRREHEGQGAHGCAGRLAIGGPAGRDVC